ncbi:MAG TPA: tetratricopeptide repeat protein [Chthoniobacterales bacterium]|nr:tetratricopeptide repeat protein [Chthoniobacterales bacterium]
MKRQFRLPIKNCELFVVLLLLLAPDKSPGQTIILTTGQRIDALAVRRDGDMILGKVQIGAGSGEVGYHIPQIAKIEFPEPRGLKEASDLLDQGHAEKALAEISQVVSFYEAFKDVPGGWWAQSALIKVSALGALQRDAEAESLAAQIEKSVSDPETARAARLQLAAGLIRKEDFEKAAKICDSTIKESTLPDILAEAWIKKGDLLFAEKKWDEALMAYLHVPIFYPDEKLSLPRALLGSALSYARLDDNERARKSLTQLIETFPKSAEAATAHIEIQKIGK